MLSLEELTASLEGSPYSLPDEVDDRPEFADLLSRSASLEDRCNQVRQALVAQFDRRLERATRVTEIYESNAIEGKTASLAETSEILEARSMWDAESALARYTLHGALSQEPKVKDVIGLAAARILVDNYISERERSVRENDLRDMHSLLLRDQYGAGRYKQYLNSIDGSDHIPVAPVDVPDAMNRLTRWLADSECPLLWKSAVCHAWLTHIHPFDDGNGRMARLLANYILGFGCFPPLIVKASVDRPRYISALAHSDSAGDILPLVRVFVRVLNRGIELMERPDFAWSLFQADLRVREDSLYRRWSQTVDRLFEEVAARLVLERTQLWRVGRLSASDFELLAVRDKSGNGWMAKVGRNGDEAGEVLVWAGFPSVQLTNRLDTSVPFPSFFLSSRDHGVRPTRPYRPVVGDKAPLFDEFCVLADEERVLIRRGTTVRRLPFGEATELIAALLTNYLERKRNCSRNYLPYPDTVEPHPSRRVPAIPTPSATA